MVDMLPLASVLAVLGFPVYLLLIAGVLAICGVSREEIAKWALKQAYRQRMIDFVRAVRQAPEETPAADESLPTKLTRAPRKVSIERRRPSNKPPETGT